MDRDESIGALIFAFGSILVVSVIVALLWGANYFYKSYNVWSMGMEGQAELAHAHYNRQIAVVEAQAKKEAAIELANAEIERAKGIAKANEIIGSSLKGNEEYLRYLWIDSLQNANNKIIYVPTEANLPVLEAGRLK
jgi:regulator of protease activity HflC (stomatin/prohibitin superfamily)